MQVSVFYTPQRRNNFINRQISMFNSRGTVIVLVEGALLHKGGKKNHNQGGQIMPNKKDDQKSGSESSVGNTSDREFESQGINPSSGKGSQGQQAGSFGKGTGSQPNMDDDDMDTAGGRKGNFSEKNRDSDAQWSPGGCQPVHVYI